MSRDAAGTSAGATILRLKLRGMVDTQSAPQLSALEPKVRRMFALYAAKIRAIETSWAPANGAPVFTVGGRYTSRGWTEWTQGFQFGSAILQFDATDDAEFLEIGRQRTVDAMAPHLSHIGVHDHGFNNVSTYGNLLRLMKEGRIAENLWERRFYEVALKVSGAVQAARWSRIAGGGGYIYSFNGPHSLFVDTIRTLRSPAVSHLLGHVLMGENDRKISLIDRVAQHARATAKYAVWYGEGRDAYDVRGRTAHESIFNVNDGNYRCPNSQQGYSPFSIPYWDPGAPGLAHLGDWRGPPADPYNDYEPVDSSAAAIGAQGLLRLGRRLKNDAYFKAGLKVCGTLFDEPYLSTDENHQGLILHSVYHRPNGWDLVPANAKVPAGESSMWGDYHAREVGLYLLRLMEGKPYLKFWGSEEHTSELQSLRHVV